MCWRTPSTNGEGIRRCIDSGHSYHLSCVIDIQSSTIESRTQCAEVDDFIVFPQNRMLLWVPRLRIDFRSARASGSPTASIDRGCVAEVHARRRTQFIKDPSRQPETVAREPALVAEFGAVGIGI